MTGKSASEQKAPSGALAAGKSQTPRKMQARKRQQPPAGQDEQEPRRR